MFRNMFPAGWTGPTGHARAACECRLRPLVVALFSLFVPALGSAQAYGAAIISLQPSASVAFADDPRLAVQSNSFSSFYSVLTVGAGIANVSAPTANQGPMSISAALQVRASAPGDYARIDFDFRRIAVVQNTTSESIFAWIPSVHYGLNGPTVVSRPGIEQAYSLWTVGVYSSLFNFFGGFVGEEGREIVCNDVTSDPTDCVNFWDSNSYLNEFALDLDPFGSATFEFVISGTIWAAYVDEPQIPLFLLGLPLALAIIRRRAGTCSDSQGALPERPWIDAN